MLRGASETDVTRLLNEAAERLDAEGGPITASAQRVIQLSERLLEGAQSLADRSIGARIGNQRAWQNDNVFMYYAGEGRPEPGDEYEPDRWRHLTEGEGRRLVEEYCGVEFDQVKPLLAEVRDGTDRLRRAVLAAVEPVAHEAHFSFAQEGLAAVRKQRIEVTPAEAADAYKPGHFILDDIDTRIGTPLHIANAAWAAAAHRTAQNAMAVVTQLQDLVATMQNRTKLRGGPAPGPAPTSDRAAPAAPDASPLLTRLAVFCIWTLIAGTGYGAILAAGWLGDGGRAVPAKAAAAAASCALWPRCITNCSSGVA
jgi:hypothetical protein